MKPQILIASLALAFAAPAFAQDVPQSPPPESEQAQPANPPTDDTLAKTGHSTTVYHGPHRYPARERGRQAGDPPIIDHSADTLIVEPTHSTVTVMPPPNR